MLVRTCTAGDQQLHDLKAVELSSIVHSSVAIRVLGIQHFCLAVFGQSIQPLANHILSPISGSLVNQGRGEGERREGRGGGGGEGERQSRRGREEGEEGEWDGEGVKKCNAVNLWYILSEQTYSQH